MDLLNGAGSPQATDLIKDGTEATFMADVIEARATKVELPASSMMTAPAPQSLMM